MKRAAAGALFVLAMLGLGALGAGGAGFYRTHDFYALYSGSRLVAAGLDPYDDVVWCAETEHTTPEAYDQSRDIAVCFTRYAYPLWTALLLLPFGILPLPVASSLWLALTLGLCVAAMRWSWLAVHGAARWAAVYVLIVIFSQPFALELALGQMSGVLFAVTAYVAYAISRREERSGGAALAFAAVKPNVLPVFAAAILIWSAAARRGALLRWSLGTGAILFAVSFLVRPSWPLAWWQELFGRQIGHAREYATSWGLAAIDLDTPTLAPLLIVALVIGVMSITRERLANPVVLPAVAIPVSLFATPYAWSYDYLVLAFTWAFVLSVASHSSPATARLLLLAVLLTGIAAPWALWVIAERRHTESLSALVPALAALWAAVASRLGAAQATLVRSGPVPRGWFGELKNDASGPRHR